MSAPNAGVAPIADLTYRNYEGPLRTRGFRWWIVALAGIRIAVGRWYFWLFLVLATLPFLFTGFVLYMQNVQQQGGAMLNPMGMGEQATKLYAREFFQPLRNQGFWTFAMALAIGAGSIASDTRANALLVYLSKPITRIDYLLGKWMGIFLMLFAAAASPSLLLYLFCLISFNDQGFFKNEPWLMLQAIGASAVPAAVHASLLIGCSAFSKSGRVAGAVYAGFFFLSGVVASILWGILFRGNAERGVLVKNLSLDGIIGSVQQNIFNITIQQPIFHRDEGVKIAELAAPNLGIMGGIALALIAVSMFLAWRKIRAVEVVRG